MSPNGKTPVDNANAMLKAFGFEDHVGSVPFTGRAACKIFRDAGASDRVAKLLSAYLSLGVQLVAQQALAGNVDVGLWSESESPTPKG